MLTQALGIHLIGDIVENYLTFVKASDSIDRMKTVADWARQHKISNAAVVRTANSAMIRLHVPKLDMEKGFEYVDKDELNQCFEAVRELTNFANMIETVISVIHK